MPAKTTDRTEQESLDHTGSLPLLAILFVWIGLFAISVWRYAPPAPSPSSAPPNVFSAGRAEGILNELVGDGVPHPAGTPQNGIVRERILNRLKSFGYDPIVQETSQHLYRDLKQPRVALFNIMARLKGLTDRAPIMLAAHYDSRPEGPGACDDGVGVAAVLEIARMLKQEDPPQRDVIFLITDGEEFGLLGADRFVAEHPWAQEPRVVVNLEARGTTGPSLMFETSHNSLWLIRLFSRTVKRPFTSSIFYEVYKRLPRDTDFTIFKRAGIQGFNFAFIGDVQNYHTPDDNLQNADLGSLQHHGDNALSLLRELTQMEIESQPQGSAVYFDLLSLRVIWWPEVFSTYMSVIALLLCVICAWKLIALGYADLVSIIRAAGSVAIAIIGFIFVCLFINGGLSMDDVLANRFPKAPVFVGLAYWLGAVLISAGIACWNPMAAKWPGLWLCCSGFWSLMAVLTSLIASGASYLFVVPALAMAGSGAVIMLMPHRRYAHVLVTMIPAISAGVIWLPLERLFYDAVGFGMNPVLIARVTIVSTTLIPIFGRMSPQSIIRVLVFVGLGSVTCLILATLLN